MPLFIFDLALAVVTAVVSVGLGYWLRSRSVGSSGGASVDNHEQQKRDHEKKLAEETLARLHDLASSVAADVGAHSDRVQEINTELTEGDQTSDAVLEAMSKLIKANERMQHQLDTAESQIEQQARQMQSYEAEARTDALTGIANRRAFDDFTHRQQSEFQRHGRPVTVMMMDVDKFKKFNDTYGHQAGDEVLKGVAEVLTKAMRDIDLVARYGGEEFSVVFPGEKVQDCGGAAQRARAAIEAATFHHEGTDLKVTASFGLAELRQGESMIETIKRADDALYAAKKAGRNNAHWHDGEQSHPVVFASAAATPVALPEPVEAQEEVQEAVPEPVKPILAPVDEPRSEPVASSATPAPDQAQQPASEPAAAEEVAGISKKDAFVSDVSRRVAEWKRTGSPLSLVSVGIDDLKKIAQKHGAAGEQIATKAAAQFLKAAMRDMDHVAQFGDDTFGLLLPSADLEAAEKIAERLRQAIAKCALPVGAAHLRFTVSLGVSDARDGDEGATLLTRAEQAMNGARGQGGNRTLVYKGREIVPAGRLAGAGA